ncbi:MAG: LacI family DNA-binding transcriptional regulator [Spirochaetota bacterium]
MRKSKITIKDVADRAGFSISTVSHVINSTRFVEEKTKKRILEVIQELNYRPNLMARSLKGKGTKTIGIIISNIREVFFSEIISSIENNANKMGYNIMLCDSEDDSLKEKIYIDILMQKGIDGLIFAPVNTAQQFDEQFLGRLPTVQIDRKLLNSGWDFVGIDNVGDSRKAALHLLDRGYSRVGFVGYNTKVYTMEKRIEGYQKALSETGQGSPLIKIVKYKNQDTISSIKRWLLKCGGINAVICGNDNICFETLAAVEEAGMNIPSDIGIVSFDDSKWFRFLKCPVSAIKQPTEEIGRTAIELLVDKIENGASNSPRELLLKSELVIRISCSKGISESNTVRCRVAQN